MPTGGQWNVERRTPCFADQMIYVVILDLIMKETSCRSSYRCVEEDLAEV